MFTDGGCGVTVRGLHVLPVFLLVAKLALASNYGGGSVSLGLGRPHGVHNIIDCGHSFPSLGSGRLRMTGAINVHPLRSQRRTRDVGRGLARVASGRFCIMSSLARSVPCLIPHTDTLLSAVNSGFLSSLTTGKLGPGRIVIASMLHARDSIGHLHHEGKGTSTGSTRYFKTAFSID